MNLAAVHSMIAAGGVPYAQVRPSIQPGDLLLLHHEFVEPWYRLSLYDKQIDIVQEFTGPFAHIATLDRVQIDGEDRVIVWESVVPRVRNVLVSVTAEQGFFYIPMNRPMSKAERARCWAENGVNEYDKFGATLAGVNQLPDDEDANPRRWCAKFTALHRRLSGVDLGSRYVPTDMAAIASALSGNPPIYVSMK